jgi:hypothetical protein
MEGYQQPYPQPSALDYWIGQRNSTDYVTDAGTAVLLSFITCGIYGLFVIYKLVQRRDDHFKRMAAVADSSIQQLRARAVGREAEIQGELGQLEGIKNQMLMMASERGAAI